mgnify:CR=1 FL=1
MSHNKDADCHFGASGIAAIINFPLWRASTIAQSGFKIEGANVLVRYYKVSAPWHGCIFLFLIAYSSTAVSVQFCPLRP